ncbi:FAD-dependent monooxygenase [Streptomyces odontomachi]|uniref:FAD-dependent monooxygenase n=1 Tax=Streptomyces odontomachi TaxID=2944940 RepID=UPI00210B1B90|nr:FAD-dependent monooxygenase [Streptomyces sp. ODS25]
MAAADAEVGVLIVGGGPVGLTARALLERWGVRSLLVERHHELSPFPRARLVNVRSMEIFRQLGLDTEIASGAFARKYGRIRFRDTLLGREFATAAMVGVHAPISESPVLGVVTSQDRLEPVLLAAADTPMRFGVELADLTEADGSVLASLVDRARGARTRVRARYVLAADGANSTVRRLLGIDTAGPGAMGDFTTVMFDADLSRWCAHQPAGVYLTPQGAFTPLYPEGGWAWFFPTPEDAAHATHDDWSTLVSRALGLDPGRRAEVSRVQGWVMNAFVAERFRHGRTLLAGDAAHAVPVIGGLGLNAGLADAHNLCWKLAAVLHGWAGPDLVDTYETERHPVARRTLRQAVDNTKLMVEVQKQRREQLGADPEAPARQAELPWSEQYFAQMGLVLGVTYHSDAVLPDGGTPPEPSDAGADSGTDAGTAAGTGTGTGTEYVPAAAPGHRMPHLWLAPGRSTLDAAGEWFTLLTPDPARWEGQRATPWPLHVEALPHEHVDVCGLGPHGALLVRPDGHVGARWREGPPDDATLHRALAAVTVTRATPPST